MRVHRVCPAENPQIAFAVMVEYGGSGGYAGVGWRTGDRRVHRPRLPDADETRRAQRCERCAMSGAEESNVTAGALAGENPRKWRRYTGWGGMRRLGHRRPRRARSRPLRRGGRGTSRACTSVDRRAGAARRRRVAHGAADDRWNRDAGLIRSGTRIDAVVWLAAPA